MQRMRIGLLVAGLAAELLIAAWVSALYGHTFQSVPAIIAIGLGVTGRSLLKKLGSDRLRSMKAL